MREKTVASCLVETISTVCSLLFFRDFSDMCYADVTLGPFKDGNETLIENPDSIYSSSSVSMLKLLGGFTSK